jgi:hypothetical protein
MARTHTTAESSTASDESSPVHSPGKRARTDGLVVQRKPAAGETPTATATTDGAAARGDRGPRGDRAGDDPFALHLPAAAASGVVQRKAAGDQAPAPAADAADDVSPTADDIAAAGVRDGDPGLDVTWIDSLQARMLDQIDGSFAASKESAAYKKALAKDQELKDLEKAKKQAKGALADATADQLGLANTKKNHKKIEKSEEYVSGAAAIDGEYADQVESKKETIKAQVAKAGHKGKSWDEGRLAARINFMSWGIGLLGSADAVKQHFKGLVMIKGGAYLSAPAAARYNQAAEWFKGQYPGNTFPDTGVGQALRGRHQGEHSKGLQGHPLGISLDFDAYVNVHQKDGVASFMLRKFGGGANKLELGAGSYDKVQAMGKASAEGKDLSQAQVAYLKDAEKAFDDMFATSERFKEALGPSEARLKEVQALYYSSVAPASKELAAIEKDLAKERKAAKKRVGDGGDVETDAAVAALLARREQKQASFEADKAKVQGVVEEVFAPWISQLETEIGEIEAGHEREDLDAKVDYKTAERCVKEVKKAKNAKALKKVLGNKKYAAIFVGFDAGFAAEEYETVRAAALGQAEQVKAAKWQSGEIATRVELLRRFRDPRAVFGDGQQVKDKETGELEWKQKKEVGQPPIIQYLETGFARNDELGAPDRKADKEVFNGEFVAAMMRFGWYPGAAWDAVDTMHFDFRDGFDAIVGGSKSFGPTD